MKNVLSEWVGRLKGARILVAGEMGLDEYLAGECRRISPEAPVPVLEVDSNFFRLGLSANVAQNISSLGATVELVSVRGDDSDGHRMTELLDAHKIGHHLIVDKSRPTLRKVRVIAQKQHIVRIDFEKAHRLDESTSVAFRTAVIDRLRDYDALVLQDYAKGIWHPGTVTLIEEAKNLGKAVYVDPNRNSSAQLYGGATILTPNMVEAEALCGAAHVTSKLLGPDDRRLKQLATQIVETTGAAYTLITCGEWGMVCLDRERNRFLRIPTYAQEVFDVTGAGDTVVALIALMHSQGASIDECMKVSNAAAGIVVARLGTATVTPVELAAELERLEGIV
ncbi:MAG: bifunctional hydroxymethylpyrimidine kinase/phosphomethylpyrimidine kinase [Deltaproteobacteria bacterium]|nr:bifunctional hydroxymethylpyrimidine kinase/phosphomethylpyrimidine kinase [Deltaproteobacteria bacterium]MBI3295220.1 bifunctional hydroxymethylpyrimidine kinase/phosphomethylpyrimidine kinase [Deltaproteobacteria bacterium]